MFLFMLSRFTRVVRVSDNIYLQSTQTVPWRYNEQLEEFEKEQRRRVRVEKKLQEMVVEKQEKIVEQSEEIHHDIVEFAQKYFNSHEKCLDGRKSSLRLLQSIENEKFIVLRSSRYNNGNTDS